MDRPTTILMFSGGLDSTGAFWQLLKDGQQFYVHHMNLKNKENRAEAESKAVQAILKYMKNHGSFIYSESTHEYPTFNGSFIWDADITSFMAGAICSMMPWIKSVALGLTKSDIEHNTVATRIERANKIFKGMCEAEKIYPIKHLSKQEIYDMLPNDLRELAWSCRTPSYKTGVLAPCNRCIACYNMRKINKT